MNTAKLVWIRTETATTATSTPLWEFGYKTGTNHRGFHTLVELARDWPTRYHGDGAGGTVVDMEASKTWSATICQDEGDVTHTLEAGISVSAAKAAALALLNAQPPKRATRTHSPCELDHGLIGAG